MWCLRASRGREPGLALLDLSKVEQRYRAVLAGDRVGDVAFRFGASRQSVHTWLARYRAEGLAGLADRSRRPLGCSHQAEQVEVAVCKLRRAHLRWGRGVSNTS